VISEDCLESNVQKASFIPKAESGDSAKSLLVLRHKIFVTTCLNLEKKLDDRVEV